MARGKSNASNAPANGSVSSNAPRRARSNTTWINPSPNKSDIQWLEDHLQEADKLVGQLLDEFEDEWSLAIKVDSFSGRWTAQLFLNDGSGDTPSRAIAPRASTPFDALYSLAYYMLVKFRDEFPDDPATVQARWG